MFSISESALWGGLRLIYEGHDTLLQAFLSRHSQAIPGRSREGGQGMIPEGIGMGLDRSEMVRALDEQDTSI
jgi:hypothetical protein